MLNKLYKKSTLIFAKNLNFSFIIAVYFLKTRLKPLNIKIGDEGANYHVDYIKINILT